MTPRTRHCAVFAAKCRMLLFVLWFWLRLPDRPLAMVLALSFEIELRSIRCAVLYCTLTGMLLIGAFSAYLPLKLHYIIIPFCGPPLLFVY